MLFAIATCEGGCDLSDDEEAESREICGQIDFQCRPAADGGVEIGLRIGELQGESDTETRITSQASAILFCRNQVGRLARESKQEEFWIVTLSTKNQPIDYHQITVAVEKAVSIQELRSWHRWMVCVSGAACTANEKFERTSSHHLVSSDR